MAYKFHCDVSHGMKGPWMHRKTTSRRHLPQRLQVRLHEPPRRPPLHGHTSGIIGHSCPFHLAFVPPVVPIHPAAGGGNGYLITDAVLGAGPEHRSTVSTFIRRNWEVVSGWGKKQIINQKGKSSRLQKPKEQEQQQQQHSCAAGNNHSHLKARMSMPHTIPKKPRSEPMLSMTRTNWQKEGLRLNSHACHRAWVLLDALCLQNTWGFLMCFSYSICQYKRDTANCGRCVRQAYSQSHVLRPSPLCACSP